MTYDEVIEIMNGRRPKVSMCATADDCRKINEAIDIAIKAIERVQWQDTLWHDAETDPPKQNGLYYGAVDDTNSMWACQYKDGAWILDMYPNHVMKIVRWAEYTAFCQS